MTYHSLKTRFASHIVIVYALLGVLTFLAFQLVVGKVVDSLGTNYAAKQALLEQSRLMSAIQRDLSLSLKMAASPLLRQWALDENNDGLRRQASEELDSYRESFKGKSLFFAVSSSGHYYFSDGTGGAPLASPRYTLSRDNPNDQWFYRTLRDVDSFELNVDYDSHLAVTKVWFNVVVKDAHGGRAGLCGSGMDITEFVNGIVNAGESGVETILVGGDGAIEGHRDQRYVLHNSQVRGQEAKTTIYDLVDSDADRAVLHNAIASLAAGGDDAETFLLSIGGKRHIAAMSSLKEIGWYNLVLVDAAQVVSNRDFLPILVITIVSLLVVIVIIAILLNRLVLAPLSALARSSGQMAKGHFDIAMPVRTDDEIGALTRSFNVMARMVKDHSENLEQKVRDRTEELSHANQKLAESSRQVMDSIRYARLIQSSTLPDEAAVKRRVERFFALYRPRDIVGGDFYYFKESGDNFVIAVVDCTGHGVPGAFMTMTVKAVLDRVLDTMDNADPAAVLKELNRLVREALHQGATTDVGLDVGLDIGLCWCAPGQARLVFSGARLNLYRLDHGAPEIISGDRQAIGYLGSDVDFPYANHEVPLTDGDTFYLSTDGFLDQAGGPKGWGFGRRRFLNLLAAASALPFDEQKNALDRALADYQGNLPQRDDITVVGFRF